MLTAAAEGDWHDEDGRFVPLVVDEVVLEEAAALAARYGLRAYDAVQRPRRTLRVGLAWSSTSSGASTLTWPGALLARAGLRHHDAGAARPIRSRTPAGDVSGPRSSGPVRAAEGADEGRPHPRRVRRWLVPAGAAHQHRHPEFTC